MSSFSYAEEYEKLETCKNVSEEMNVVCEILSLSSSQLIERKFICEKALEVFKTFYTDCTLDIHGSSASGFGFKDSNLDLLLLPFPDYCNKDVPRTVGFMAPACTIPELFRDIKDGKYDEKRVLKFDEAYHLRLMRQLLRKHSPMFKNITYIPSFLPLLKFTFVEPAIRCHLSCSNKLVLLSTELLTLYGKLDSRVKPLVMTIKYWAKSLDLLGQGSLSNYSLTLLVIFFLQERIPPVLPSVKYLNSVSGSTRLIAGWECAFTTDVDIASTLDVSTLEDLLEEFFHFYLNFDYLRNFACLYRGEVFPISDLRNSEDTRIQSFDVKPLNIQDPFILSHNVTRKVTQENLNIFRRALYVANEILLNRSEGFHLEQLISKQLYAGVYSGTLPYSLKKLPSSTFICPLYLTYDIYAKISNKENFEKDWYELAACAVLECFETALLMTCKVVNYGIKNEKATDSNPLKCVVTDLAYEDRPETPDTPVASTSRSESNHSLILSLDCKAYSCTWVGREKFDSTDLDTDGISDIHNYILRREQNISMILISENPSLCNSEPLFTFMCNCFIYNAENFHDVMVFIAPHETSSDFDIAKEFLTTYLPKCVQASLRCEFSENSLCEFSENSLCE